jgi:hypothetical protein
MASAYAPDALRGCYDTVKKAVPSAQLSGIYANKPGYHNARAQLPSSDYSVQRSQDKKGDGWAAGALDITLQPAEMKAFTQRLIDATKAGDPRLRGVREFFGTVNGSTVTGMDVPGKYWVTSDPSHLWHVHLSSSRDHANDTTAWQDVAAVLLGSSGGSSGGSTGGGSSDMGTFKTTVYGDAQPLTNAWRTVYVEPPAGQSWFSGPCAFQAQAQLIVNGMSGSATVRFRFVTVDVKSSDGTTKSGNPNVWPQIEFLPTTGGTYLAVTQLGQIGKPASGYSRRFRLQAYSDLASGVSIGYVRASSFRQ